MALAHCPALIVTCHKLHQVVHGALSTKRSARSNSPRACTFQQVANPCHHVLSSDTPCCMVEEREAKRAGFFSSLSRVVSSAGIEHQSWACCTSRAWCAFPWLASPLNATLQANRTWAFSFLVEVGVGLAFALAICARSMVVS